MPGELVDAVVVCEGGTYHRQTAGTVCNPYRRELLCPPGSSQRKQVLTAQDLVCRRAVFELYPGAVVNVGVGIGAAVGAEAAVEGIVNDVTFTLELGAFGGTPQSGVNFGAAINASSYIAHPSMFDFYHGGGLDIAFLGAAEIDARQRQREPFRRRAAGRADLLISARLRRKSFSVRTLWQRALTLWWKTENL